MKILVTGGNGRIGSAFNRIAFDTDDEIISVSSADCNLMNLLNVYQTFDKIKPYCVIHFAADVSDLMDDVKMFYNNTLINMNVLLACKKTGVTKLIVCSSIYTLLPLKIKYTGYILAKLLLHYLCEKYHEMYNLNYICVRPANICLVDVKELSTQLVNSESKSFYQLVYIQDFVTNVYKMVKMDLDYEPLINIASQGLYDIKEPDIKWVNNIILFNQKTFLKINEFSKHN